VGPQLLNNISLISISFKLVCFDKTLILGARSFYVIDTDKKQLIEVEANSKDDLEKYLNYFFLILFINNCFI